MHLEGRQSQITTFRIQKLESLGFEWKTHNSRKNGNLKKPSLDDDTTSVRESAFEAPEFVQTTSHTQEDVHAGLQHAGGIAAQSVAVSASDSVRDS